MLLLYFCYAGKLHCLVATFCIASYLWDCSDKRMNSLDICLASICVIQWFLGLRASFFNTTQLIMLAHEDAIKLNCQSVINFVIVCPVR